jgi:hypothetical protein
VWRQQNTRVEAACAERNRYNYPARYCSLACGDHSARLPGMGPQCIPLWGGSRSRGADGFPVTHLVEHSAALRAPDDMRCQAHQFVRLNLVAAERAGKREVEVGLSFEPRRHPTRPSAERTGFRIIRCESRPRKTSDGR